MKRRIAVVALVLAAGFAFAGTAAAAKPSSIRGAFFTNWSRYARGYTVKQIPAERLNLID